MRSGYKHHTIKYTDEKVFEAKMNELVYKGFVVLSSGCCNNGCNGTLVWWAILQEKVDMLLW